MGTRSMEVLEEVVPPVVCGYEAAEGRGEYSTNVESVHAALCDKTRAYVEQTARSMVNVVADTVVRMRASLDEFEEVAETFVGELERAREGGCADYATLARLGLGLQDLVAKATTPLVSAEGVTVEAGRPWQTITKLMVHDILHEQKAYVFTSPCPKIGQECGREVIVRVRPIGGEADVLSRGSAWLDGPRSDFEVTIPGAEPGITYLTPQPVEDFLGLAALGVKVEELGPHAVVPTYTVRCWVVDQKSLADLV